MSLDNKNIIDLNLKKDEKILDFSDFQKQDIKFDIIRLQESYNQIIQTKKFEDGGGIAHFGAISLTQIPGDPDSVKGSKARGVYWTKPDKSGKEVSRDVSLMSLLIQNLYLIMIILILKKCLMFFLQNINWVE
jgi:hypothetical protein